MKGFGDAKVGKDKSPRLADLVDVFEWPQDDYASIRIVGPVYSYNNIWFDIITKAGKKVSIPKLCLDHDGKTDDYVTDVCPYRASGRGRSSKYYVVNAIIRPIQEEKKRWPAPDGKKAKHLGYECYLTKKGAKNTPVRVVVIPSSVAEKIQQMQKLNRVTNKKTGAKKTYEASDPKYGFDINILFDPSKEGARKYDVQKGDRTPLSDEELDYPIYRLDLLKSDPLDRAKREMEDLKDKIVEKKDKKDKRRGDEDDEDDDRPRGKKGKSPRVDDDDLTEIDEDDLDLDDEDDDRPRKKNKKKDKGKNKRRPSEDDGDDEDDLGDLDEDEDDRPKKRRSRDEDDDDEDDSDDGDDEDSEDDEDDESEDDEDEDDRPKKRRRDEDDEDEDDRPRKKKVSNKKKGGKKRRRD